MRLRWWFIVLAIGVLVIIGVWSLNSRYVVVGTAAGVAYKVDRWTGRSWVLVGQEEFPTRSEFQQSGGRVPSSVLNNLNQTGGAQIEINSLGAVSVTLHNNSDWHLTEILVELTSPIFSTEEKLLFPIGGKRKCSLTGHGVEPYQVGTLRGSCLTSDEVIALNQEEWSWYILEAKGWKSR